MNLYRALHGENPLAQRLLEWLGIEPLKQPNFRYRDAHLNADGTKIIISTRIGGGNREGFAGGWKYLRNIEGFLSDKDDGFDSTYAYAEFAVPEENIEEAKQNATGKDPASVGDMFKDVNKEMKDMTKEEMMNDPRFKSTIEVIEKMVKGDPPDDRTKGGAPIYKI